MILVAALGDSITAGSPGWDRTRRARAVAGGGDPESQYEHWAELRDPELTFRNCGVYGERTDEIATRLDDVRGPARTCWSSRAGSTTSRRGGRSSLAARESRAEWSCAGRSSGLRVAIADVLPWNGGYPRPPSRSLRSTLLIRELAAAAGRPRAAVLETLEDDGRPGRMREDWTSEATIRPRGLPSPGRASLPTALTNTDSGHAPNCGDRKHAGRPDANWDLCELRSQRR